MKKWSKKTNIIGSLVTLGSFPVIAAKCTEGNNGYVSKNDSPQVINPIKDGSQGQNDGDNTSNNDQHIHNSNKSDKTVKDSNPKKETDQSSTNKEMRDEATSRLEKKYSDLLSSIQSNKDKIYNLSQDEIILFLYKAFSKYGESIKDKLNSKESVHNINRELYNSYNIVRHSWSKNEDYFSKFGLDLTFHRDFFEFFDLLSTLFTDYKDGESDNKNKADELFKKTKSKLEKAYKKISEQQ